MWWKKTLTNVLAFADWRDDFVRRVFGGRAARRCGSLSLRPQLEALEARDTPTAGWTQITSILPDPNAGVSTATLLPDGDVLAKRGQDNTNGEVTNGYYLLSPVALHDTSTGTWNMDYSTGTWRRAASMNLPRVFYSSNDLPNGDVFVFGGEVTGQGFNGPTNTSEIYDPQANSWSFTSSTFPQQVGGDDPTEILASGQVLVGSITSPATYLFTPATANTADTWTFAGNRLHNDFSYEECWGQLQDGSILSYDVSGS